MAEGRASQKAGHMEDMPLSGRALVVSGYSQQGSRVCRPVWLLTAPDHTWPHRTVCSTTPDRSGPSGAFSELLMIHVVQLAPY